MYSQSHRNRTVVEDLPCGYRKRTTLVVDLVHLRFQAHLLGMMTAVVEGSYGGERRWSKGLLNLADSKLGSFVIVRLVPGVDRS